MSHQFSLCAPPAPVHPPYRMGWLRAPCDMVFWEWNDDAPNLQPFRFCTCWQGMPRATPGMFAMSRSEENVRYQRAA